MEEQPKSQLTNYTHVEEYTSCLSLLTSRKQSRSEQHGDLLAFVRRQFATRHGRVTTAEV